MQYFTVLVPFLDSQPLNFSALSRRNESVVSSVCVRNEIKFIITFPIFKVSGIGIMPENTMSISVCLSAREFNAKYTEHSNIHCSNINLMNIEKKNYTFYEYTELNKIIYFFNILIPQAILEIILY